MRYIRSAMTAVLEDLGSPGSLYFIVQKDSDGNENYSYDSSTGEYKLNYDIQNLVDNGSVIMDGNDVKSANAAYNQSSSTSTKEPVVQLTLKKKAADVFGEATTKAACSGVSIGIYYDDHFISVPKVESAIKDGSCVINGMSDYDEAEQLATFIRVGAINLKLEEMESSVAGAQLGGKALSSSVKAAIIGLILVMLFMILNYRLLPGIAGVILGIGMAVDANVIIISRIREEIAAGKSVLTSIKTGYKKAMSAIIDGNVTTFIAALVLMWLGSGTVKGFAYTLMISILVSMFTALVISRLLNLAFYAVGCRNEKLYGRAKEHKTIDFMKHRWVCFILSLVVIVAGFVGMIGYGAAGKGALNFSLEFKGGTSISADFGKDYTVEQVEDKIVPEVAKVINDNAIQASTVSGSNVVTIKTKTLSLSEREEVNQMLVDKFGVDEATIESQSIGSTISNEMRSNAVKALIVACIFMLFYIWFRFKDIRFAGSAIIALVHDVLVMLTGYALIRISVGNTFIACILTIVGYSINDTIVIFDRIRENMQGMKKQTPETLAEVANRSLTQTLSRSLNTSITTIIMVLLLFILGVSSIREFALPLMIGLISGTYSSIFIAAALWYVMKLHLGKDKLMKTAAAKTKKK